MLINLTPHPIYFKDQSGETRVIETSGMQARLVGTINVIGSIDGIPIVERTFSEVDGLPQPSEGVYYIVSSTIAEKLAKKRRDLLSPDTAGSKAYFTDENGNKSFSVTALRRHK